MRVDLPLDKKTGKSGLGHRAAGPPGRGAVAGRGPRADGPSGRRAAGPSRAVGRGPLGRGPAFSKTRSEHKAYGFCFLFEKFHKNLKRVNVYKLLQAHLI